MYQYKYDDVYLGEKNNVGLTLKEKGQNTVQEPGDLGGEALTYKFRSHALSTDQYSSQLFMPVCW